MPGALAGFGGEGKALKAATTLMRKHCNAKGQCMMLEHVDSPLLQGEGQDSVR
jgi:hypothetical protein